MGGMHRDRRCADKSAGDIGNRHQRAQILDYGAILRSLSYVDATGERSELILISTTGRRSGR